MGGNRVARGSQRLRDNRLFSMALNRLHRSPWIMVAIWPVTGQNVLGIDANASAATSTSLP